MQTSQAADSAHADAVPDDESRPKASPAPALALTVDQEQALQAIKAAYQPGGVFLLTGYAGTGKTTLLQQFTRDMRAAGRSVALTAPTHKAVAVLARKLAEAKIQEVDCRTIHSLLSLKPRPQTEQLIFARDSRADPIEVDVVVIDECSMVSASLNQHIKEHLANSFVLLVGDPAQLPPVGEVESETFSTPDSVHLTTIVRQAAGNPILAAADIVRRSQGGPVDLAWCRAAALENGTGVFLPGEAAHRWMRKAFTSDAFNYDPDSFRYLAWTNERVRQVNELVRSWRYGEDIPTPFMAGERALFREPVVINASQVFAANQEVEVVSIARSTFTHKLEKAHKIAGWTAAIPSWRLRLRDDDGEEREVHMAADGRELKNAMTRIRTEAAESRIRWKHLHELKEHLAQLQSIYALTVHRSQGSTFSTVFLDLPDIRRNERHNLLEAQQMLYVAITRASKRVVVVGGARSDGRRKT